MKKLQLLGALFIMLITPYCAHADALDDAINQGYWTYIIAGFLMSFAGLFLFVFCTYVLINSFKKHPSNPKKFIKRSLRWGIIGSLIVSIILYFLKFKG